MLLVCLLLLLRMVMLLLLLLLYGQPVACLGLDPCCVEQEIGIRKKVPTEFVGRTLH